MTRGFPNDGRGERAWWKGSLSMVGSGGERILREKGHSFLSQFMREIREEGDFLTVWLNSRKFLPRKKRGFSLPSPEKVER